MKRLFLAVLILVITQVASTARVQSRSERVGSDALGTHATITARIRQMAVEDLRQRPALGDVPSTSNGAETAGSLALTAVGTPSLGGYATFYDVASGNAAAGPDLRAALGGDPAFRGETVRVCSGSRCLRTTLTDWCACRDRNGRPTLIDLARSDFARLGSTSRGVLMVTIELDAKPVGTLPPTDMEGP